MEAARAGIDAGFEFIHIDLSQARKDATDQEIIAATRAVVEYAASTTGALVESEPHYFGGSSNVHEEGFDYEEIRKTFSTPEGGEGVRQRDRHRHVRGSRRQPARPLPGAEAARPRAPPTETRRDRRQHQPARRQRNSPTTSSRAAARIGVSKVNLNSDLRYAYRTTLERQLREHPDEYAIVRLMPPVVRAVQDVVEHRIDVYGSAGRAVP